MAFKPIRLPNNTDPNLDDGLPLEFRDTELIATRGIDLNNLASHIITIDGNDMTFQDVNAGGPWTLEDLLNINKAGKILNPIFVVISSANDTWMSYSDRAITSDEIPYVCKYSFDLEGYYFANSNDNADCDLEIYKNDVLTATIEIRNSRYAWDNNTVFASFIPGDRISIFLRDQGGDTKDAAVELSLVITDDTPSSGSVPSF